MTPHLIGENKPASSCHNPKIKVNGLLNRKPPPVQKASKHGLLWRYGRRDFESAFALPRRYASCREARGRANMSGFLVSYLADVGSANMRRRSAVDVA